MIINDENHEISTNFHCQQKIRTYKRTQICIRFSFEFPYDSQQRIILPAFMKAMVM